MTQNDLIEPNEYFEKLKSTLNEIDLEQLKQNQVFLSKEFEKN